MSGKPSCKVCRRACDLTFPSVIRVDRDKLCLLVLFHVPTSSNTRGMLMTVLLRITYFHSRMVLRDNLPLVSGLALPDVSESSWWADGGGRSRLGSFQRSSFQGAYCSDSNLAFAQEWVQWSGDGKEEFLDS